MVVLAETTPLFKTCLSRDPKLDETCQSVETQASAAEKKHRKSISETEATQDATGNILIQMQLVGAHLANIEESTKATIKEHEDEARRVRREAKMRIKEMMQKLEEDQKLVGELDAVLATDDDL